MRILVLESLPQLDENFSDIEVATAGNHGLIRTTAYLALCRLDEGTVAWRVDRADVAEHIRRGGRYRSSDIYLWGSNLWIDLDSQVVVELSLDGEQNFQLDARCLDTGRMLWSKQIRCPEPADWAEATPAWPSAPTEEIYAFLSQAKRRLVLCLYRQTRRSRIFTSEFSVLDLPEFQCQTDLYSLDPRSGQLAWTDSVLGMHVSILDFAKHRGLWSNGSQFGWINFESGSSIKLDRHDYSFGVPTSWGDAAYFPWISPKQKSMGYLRVDSKGTVDQEFGWPERKARSVLTWPSVNGVAIQVNDQKIVWTVLHDRVWEQRAKPYIYQAFANDTGDVFVATDGNGGRLLGFDRTNGHETFNFRPVSGGLAQTHFFPERHCAIARVAMKKSYRAAPQMIRFDTNTKAMQFLTTCWTICTRWTRGVVFVTGDTNRRVAVLDLES